MADNLAVVLAAAGTGSRMKSDINKQFILLKGKPVICYSLDLLERLDLVKEIIIVAHPNEIDYCQENIVSKYGYTKITGVVAGGPTRQDSVGHGLECLNKDTDIVAIHDGARPLVTEALFLDLTAAAREWGAAIPGISARDSLKRVDQQGFIKESLDRAVVVAVQTPQVFNYAGLIQAYKKALADKFQATDDAALYERYTGRVKIVPGYYHNIKITTREDLLICESYLGQGEMNK